MSGPSTSLKEAFHITPTEAVIGQRITESLKGLPPDCSSELMVAAIRRVLPNAVVIGAKEARQVTTSNDAKRLLPAEMRNVFDSLPQATQAEILDTIRSVGRSTANDRYLVLEYDAEGNIIIEIIVGFCVLCAQWVWTKKVRKETPRYVDDVIFWLVSMVLTTFVCLVCGHMWEDPPEVIMHEPVPLCSCGNYATWRGYWYCEHCQVAF